ncbi:MAG: beta-lactamase family protein [Theionarchaea archaeon]|nr:beta-lactamase family protein [Theionarchaea archaeon]
MKSSAIFLIVMVSLCIAQNPPDNTGDNFAALDDLLESEAPVHGGLALVLVKNGEIIYDRGFSGFTCDTVVPIASATKWLSGAVIMVLVDEGVLSLDDRAADYLDNYTGLHGEMTVRQLFSHTSGLPGHSSSIGIPGSDDILGNKQITLAESVNMIAEVELLADPGTQFYYGGLSMQVAGRIAEIAGGKEWCELFEEKIADTLGMTETDYNGLGKTNNPRIAGSIQTSAHQYIKFLEMLLAGGSYNGKQILSQQAVDEMLRDHTDGVPIVHSPWSQYNLSPPIAEEVRYGIGCWREIIDETGGIREASSQGAFGFSPWIDVERNLAGVLAVKSRLTKVMSLYLEMKEIVREIVDSTSESGLNAHEYTLAGLYNPENCLFTFEFENYIMYDSKREKKLQLRLPISRCEQTIVISTSEKLFKHRFEHFFRFFQKVLSLYCKDVPRNTVLAVLTEDSRFLQQFLSFGHQ